MDSNPELSVKEGKSIKVFSYFLKVSKERKKERALVSHSLLLTCCSTISSEEMVASRLLFLSAWLFRSLMSELESVGLLSVPLLVSTRESESVWGAPHM